MSSQLNNRWCRRLTAVAVASAMAVAAAARAEGTPADVDRRVNEVMAKLTPQDKERLLGGVDDFFTRDVPAAGLPRFKFTDGPVGTRNDGKTTAYPAGVLLAATWDPAIAEREGVALGRDARSRGDNVLLGPGVNICRVPENGRDFEYFGEDPLLAGRLAAAYCRGVQSQGVAACVKHFDCNNQETQRDSIDVQVSERALHEIYLPAFERGHPRRQLPHDHGVVQQDQRPLGHGQPLPADHRPPRPVALRRAGHVRLGGGPRDGRRAHGRPGPGDARPQVAVAGQGAAAGRRRQGDAGPDRPEGPSVGPRGRAVGLARPAAEGPVDRRRRPGQRRRGRGRGPRGGHAPEERGRPAAAGQGQGSPGRRPRAGRRRLRRRRRQQLHQAGPAGHALGRPQGRRPRRAVRPRAVPRRSSGRDVGQDCPSLGRSTTAAA